MMWLSFAQLALATPVLTVTGDCPGPATIDMTEISAFGTAALLVGSGPGSEVVPAGPCAGIPTGLADDPVFPTDAGGLEDTLDAYGWPGGATMVIPLVDE